MTGLIEQNLFQITEKLKLSIKFNTLFIAKTFKVLYIFSTVNSGGSRISRREGVHPFGGVDL